MSGHSKWSQIKRKKAALDQKKGQAFSKMAKQIELAAQKGGDPATNFALREVIDQAKAINMPAATVERSIKKGSGAGEDKKLEEIMYEAYGPGGVALLVLTVSDNKNRTVADVKHILAKAGGSLAGEGSVKWLFKEQSYFYFASPTPEQKTSIENIAIENGAEDIASEEEGLMVTGEKEVFNKLKEAFSAAGLASEKSGIEMLATNTVEIDEKKKKSIEKLISNLEDNDDVQEVFSNHE